MLSRSALILSLLAAPCLLVGATAQPAEAAAPEAEGEAVVSGVVRDHFSREPLANALVILSCECLEAPREAITNSRGIYSFGDLPPGEYSISVLAGVSEVRKFVTLPAGAKFRANFVVNPEREQLVEIIVEAAPVPSNTAASMTIGMDEAKMLPVGSDSSRDFTAVVDLAPRATRDAAGIRLQGTTAAEYGHPVAGTLTAGTLDDNLSDELERFARGAQHIAAPAREAALGPRVELLVVDAEGRPVNDAQLYVSASRSRGEARLRTGTDGRAIINRNLDLGDASNAQRDLADLRVRAGGVELAARVELGQGTQRIELPLQRSPAEAEILALDLVLVVDTTGSMSDELDWLATELRAIVSETLAQHPKVDARLGVVAYRDLGDQYVTRRFELSYDHLAFERFLAGEAAIGGGDTPEAVDQALVEASRMAWRHDRQAAKVVLLVGDAPPHDDKVPATLAAFAELREAGVSIYPVASSGVDDLAELLFRTLAADSAAQYLFLTDDSGIGNPHAKPHAEDYEVETLQAALLRILAAELRGEQAELPATNQRRDPPAKPGTRPKAAAFELRESLFDDAGQRALFGGPELKIGLF